jgi:long-chain acyl-CoA synthetase
VRPHLASLVEEFRKHAADTAVVAHRGNRRYRTTYGELAEIAGRFAAELIRNNVASGERVVLWGENSAQWIGVFFGCMLRGVVAVPLDAAGSTEFAARIVKDVSPKLIVGDRSLLRSLATGISQIFLSDVESQLPREPVFTVSEVVNEHTPFQIVFTSGTTSEPKGIVHTHRNVLASLQPIEDEIEKYRKYERVIHPLRFLHTLPLSHVFGQFMGLWVPALLAAELHFGEQLDPARMTELIRRERISVLVAVPRILQLLRAHLLTHFKSLLHHIEQAKDLSIWKRWWRFRQLHRTLGWKFLAIISGGASLPTELETFWNRLGFALIQGYGLTETAALVTLNHPFRIARGTIGKALPNRELRISDEGEILVRGDMLSTTTWQNGSMQQRENEWLATGDLALKNESGELQFLGRKGDAIVTGSGMNVHPADVEAALMKQLGIRGCVVVPCETLTGTEPVAAVLFSGSDDQLQEAAIQANKALAEHQQIRRILRWPKLQFPYTSTGKLLRRKIAQWASEEIADQRQKQTPTRTQNHDALISMIAEITNEHIANSDDKQRLSEDLHLDSLGRVQLQSTLEQKLGLELENDAIATVETLGDLRSMIDRNIDTNHSTQAGETADEHSAQTAAQSNTSHPHIQPTKNQKANTLARVYPRWPWSWPIRALRITFIELIIRPLIWLLAAPRIVRNTHAEEPTPTLVIANHVTAYDGALVLYALPGKLRRKIAIAMSGEMLLDLRRGQNQANALLNVLAPPAYWLLIALFNVYPLPRQQGFRKSFAHAGEAMDRGYSVLIFPEGTRSRDGGLHPFRQGIGLLAQESRVPVLPIALIGLGEMRTQNSRWLRSGKLEIRIGKTIPIEEDAQPAQLTAQFEKNLRQLLQERIPANYQPGSR